MKNKDILLACICIGIGFIYRMIPNHPPNVTPIAAMALVGGLYIKKRHLAYLVPLVALFASDLILNNTLYRAFFTEQTGLIIWADYMYWTYGAFLVTVLLGFWLSNKPTFSKILIGGLVASVLFFLLTNFGSWLRLPLYTKDVTGLLTSYTAAIPFFRNTLLGNLAFTAVFVGSIEMLMRYQGRPALVKS